MNPNSQHQLWSHWTFRVWGKYIPLDEIELNAANWLREGFGSVGQARVYEQASNGSMCVVIEANVEGVPANEPGYVESVRQGFRVFVHRGWGPTVLCGMDVEVLAGDPGTGKSPSQLVVIGGCNE
jgi:hypothetical protein